MEQCMTERKWCVGMYQLVNWYGYVYPGNTGASSVIVTSFIFYDEGWQTTGEYCNIGYWTGALINYLYDHTLQPIQIGQDGSVTSTGTLSYNFPGPPSIWGWRYELAMGYLFELRSDAGHSLFIQNSPPKSRPITILYHTNLFIRIS